MSALASDVSYAFRLMRRTPALTAVMLAVIALGIGAAGVVSSALEAVFLRPLPYRNPERLAVVWETHLASGSSREVVSAANLADWRRDSHSFGTLSAWRFWFFNLGGDASAQAERVQGLQVDAAFLPLLGARPSLGRVFAADEEQAGRDRVAILSDALWRRRFGADTAVLGRAIRVDGASRTVVGILPPSFRFFRVLNRDVDLWVPLVLDAGRLDRSDHSINVYGRLAPGATFESAQAEMDTLARRLELQYPATNAGRGARVAPLQRALSERSRPALALVASGVALVLAIACANVAHLLLVRGAARRREVAVRSALGASRARLLRQLLTESVLLAAMGGGAGLVAALWGVDLLERLVPYTAVLRVEAFRLDGSVVAFTLLLTTLSGVAFGLAPALQLSGVPLAEVLRDEGTGSSRRGARLRRLLVFCEVALSTALVISSALMLRSANTLVATPRGIEPKGVETAQVWLAVERYAEPRQVAAFFERLLGRLRALPGIEAAGAVNFLPVSGVWDWVPFRVEGRPGPAVPAEQAARYSVVGGDYFRALGISLLAGRDLSDRDSQAAPRVAVISEAMARRHWPGENPLGRTITLLFPAGRAPWRPAAPGGPLEIVGVVGDTNEDGITGATSAHVYLPYLQSPSPLMHLAVRGAADVRAAVRRAVREIDPEQAVSAEATMEEVVAGSSSQPRFVAALLGVFAALALALSAIGVYTVVSYGVKLRAREVGIRRALGAGTADVLAVVGREGLAVTLAGIAAGTLAARGAARLFENLLFGVKPGDPGIYALAAGVLAAVAFAASWIPARRAVHIDPAAALRHE